MRLVVLIIVTGLLFQVPFGLAQEKTILVPKQISGAPFKYDDQDDLFGQAYRWFLEGEVNVSAEKLRDLISNAGFKMDLNSYYVVVAHFTGNFSPIGMFHGSDDFSSTRMYGLNSDNLYYIFISREQGAPSFLSVLATAKESHFIENLPAFLGLFFPLPIMRVEARLPGQETWVDVRQFEIPEAFRKNSDLSFMVKKDLADEKFLARAVFDNTAKERWSYGMATAITSIDDVDIIIGDDGTIIVKPKPNLDLATFPVINYHFKPVDTKAKTVATSFHLLGGLRLANFIEPIVGVGGGISLGFIDLHLFAGYSLEFANELKEGFSIGQKIRSF